MIVIDPGHCYGLKRLDVGRDEHAVLQFVKREGPNYPGNVGTSPGVLIQEVLRACIDRLHYVQKQIPCPQNIVAIEHLRWAIFVLEARAAARHDAECPIVSRTDLENIPVEENGHWKFEKESA